MDGYLLDNRQAEAGARFEALATLFNPTTFRHVEALGIVGDLPRHGLPRHGLPRHGPRGAFRTATRRLSLRVVRLGPA